jgi:hypothetical protein
MSYYRSLIQTATPLLLDLYPGAAAAYSLRKLRTAYTGAAIRVRRSSDNAEQDIGFVDNELNTASLLSFVGSGNGFVRTWYDQSGNARDTTQTTEGNQPQIVASGSLITVNNKAGIRWTNGQNQRLIANFTTIAQPVSFFSVSKLSAASGINASTLFDSYNNSQFVLYNSGTIENPNNTFIATAGVAGTDRNLVIGNANQNLFSGIFNTSTSQMYLNNTLLKTYNVGSNGLAGISIGNLRGNPSPITGGYDWSGEIQELVFYSSQSSNRSAINTAINSYYSIY